MLTYSVCGSCDVLLRHKNRTDADLQAAAQFRSKSRIPVLAYLHWSGAVIARSAQPMKGPLLRRSLHDENLVKAVLAGPRTIRNSSMNTAASGAYAGADSAINSATVAAVGEQSHRIGKLMAQINAVNEQADHTHRFTERGKAMHHTKKASLEARLATLLDEQERHGAGSFQEVSATTGNVGGGGSEEDSKDGNDGKEHHSGAEKDEDSRPYHIVDARPKLNALANQAAGKGFEHASHYGTGCTVTFLEIDNIHTMRGSLEALIEACQAIAENGGGDGATGGAARAARRGRRGRTQGRSNSTSVSFSHSDSSNIAPTIEDTATAPPSTSTLPSHLPRASGSSRLIEDDKVVDEQGASAYLSAAASAASSPPHPPARELPAPALSQLSPVPSRPSSTENTPADVCVLQTLPASSVALPASRDSERGGGGGSDKGTVGGWKSGTACVGVTNLDDEEAGDSSAFAPAMRDGIERSHWLLHVRKVLVGAVKVARLVGVEHESVLVHCSDGWDRTAQLTALAQLLIDPHYRTIAGFNELIQKEWLSFGHKFSDRCSMVGQAGSSEASPIFTQFLDCVWQLIQRAPSDAFEFTTAYLLAIHNAVANRRYGTFLCNTERERLQEHSLPSRTACLWAELTAELTVQQLAAASKEEHVGLLGAAVGVGIHDVEVAAVQYSNTSFINGVEGLLAVEFERQSDVNFFNELYLPKRLPTRS